MSLPDWARAYGGPLFAAAIRTTPEDFQVTEVLGWDLSGDGEHDYLWIEKTGANTEWVSRQLARHADVPNKDVGYAGLKDRQAVTRQWFSVPRWNSPDWDTLMVEGVEVLDVRRHLKKLRRGAHQSNDFRIVLRTEGIDEQLLNDRIVLIREQGVPNYFGEQRFGRDGNNLRLADDWAAGKRLPRHKRSLAISTARSFLFNEALDARVKDGSWNTLQVGDKANLDGTGSVFDISEIDEELLQRCSAMDIHPAGELPGEGSGSDNERWQTAFNKVRVEPGTRSFRLRVSDLDCAVVNDTATVSFSLGRGAFATAVLQEICEA